MNISNRHSNSNFAYQIVIHWSLFKLLIVHTKEKPFTTNGYFSQNLLGNGVKRVSKIWDRIYYLYSFTPIQNSKSFDKTQTLNAGTLGLIPETNCLKFLTLPFYQKKYSNWMAILSTFESTTFDKLIRCPLKCFILT